MSDTGVVRRLRALMWLGMRRQEIAEKLGSSHESVTRTVFGHGVEVDEDRARKLYMKSIINPEPVDNEESSLARELGWYGPGAWDDIDNEHAIPEPTLHPLTTATEMIRDLKKDKGWTNTQIAKKFGVSRQLIRKVLNGQGGKLDRGSYSNTRETYLKLKGRKNA
jgi:hypothetical protein